MVLHSFDRRDPDQTAYRAKKLAPVGATVYRYADYSTEPAPSRTVRNHRTTSRTGELGASFGATIKAPSSCFVFVWKMATGSCYLLYKNETWKAKLLLTS